MIIAIVKSQGIIEIPEAILKRCLINAYSKASELELDIRSLSESLRDDKCNLQLTMLRDILFSLETLTDVFRITISQTPPPETK
tara:strand:+ start:536 stop:787 length:252 start_codon:yes stop_codon:yes gene_type:complete